WLKRSTRDPNRAVGRRIRKQLSYHCGYRSARCNRPQTSALQHLAIWIDEIKRQVEIVLRGIEECRSCLGRAAKVKWHHELQIPRSRRDPGFRHERSTGIERGNQRGHADGAIRPDARGPGGQRLAGAIRLPENRRSGWNGRLKRVVRAGSCNARREW